MKKLQVLLIIIFASTILVKAQKTLSLVCPQNIIIKAQDLWYGVYLHNSAVINPSVRSPFVHISLHNKNGQEIVREQFKLESNYFTGKLTFPKDINAASYILTATIYNQDISNVLIESSQILHVIDKNTNELAQFGSGSVSISNTSINTMAKGTLYSIMSSYQNLNNNYKTRDKVCLDNSNVLQEYIAVSNSDFSTDQNEMYFEATDLNGYQSLYAIPYSIATTSSLGYGLYSLENKTFTYLKKLNPTTYLFSSDKSFNNTKVQIIDAQNLTKLNESPKTNFPQPKWNSQVLISMNADKLNLNKIRQQLENIHILNSTKNVENKEVKSLNAAQIQLKPDAQYVMANYPPFENLHLFLFEAVTGVKAMKIGNEYDMRVVNTRNRTHFPASPVVIIDGKIEPMKAAYEIPFLDIKTINIYRELNTVRTNYGGLAKNGIVELITKKGNNLDETGITTILGPVKKATFSSSIDMNNNFNISPFLYLGSNMDCIQHNDAIGNFKIKRLTKNGIESLSYNVNL
jgi:hypothetical protein